MKRRQHGTAIIAALLIVSIVSIIATGLALRLQIEIRRTELIDTADRQLLLSQWVVAWAKWQLQQPTLPSLPAQFPEQQDIATVTGQIIDAQAFYNLNSQQPKQLARLLELTAGIESERANDIAQRISQPQQRYISKSQIRRWLSASEYLKLAPHITALPGKTPININGNDAYVLASLSSKLDVANVMNFIKARQASQPFKDVAQALQQPVLQNAELQEDQLTTTSNYFLIEATVTQEQLQRVITTLVQRKAKAQDANEFTINQLLQWF